MARSGPEHLLLGIVEDACQPAAKVRVSRRHRQIIAHVGLPEGYQGAAGLLLAALEVDLDRLREAVTVTTPGISHRPLDSGNCSAE